MISYLSTGSYDITSFQKRQQQQTTLNTTLLSCIPLFSLQTFPIASICPLFPILAQVLRCTLQYFHMKRSLLLKQNRSVVNLKPPQQITFPKKEQRSLLPPIASVHGQEMLKTLNMVMMRMEAFVEQHPGNAAQVIGQCLQALRTHLAKPEEEWGARSQVLSVKRADVQKIQGRKLYEKMRPGKLEQLPLRNEVQVAAALRGKVAELEKNCQVLGQRVDQLSKKLNQKQEELQRNKQIIDKTQKLSDENAQLSIKLQTLLADLPKRQSHWKQTLRQLRVQCRQKQEQLNAREQQIAALWQAYFSSKTCPL